MKMNKMSRGNLQGRPRTVTGKQVDDICRLVKQHSNAEIATILKIKPNIVHYYLKKNKLLPEAPKKQPKQKKIKLKLSKIISFLEEHFGRPLHLDSCSMFSKARIERGICLYIIHKYSRERWDYVCQELNLLEKSIKKDVAYAVSKDVDILVTELESKIKTKYGTL